MEQKRTIERLKQELKRANDQVKFLTMGGCTCKLDNMASGMGGSASGPQASGNTATNNGVASPANSSGADSKMQSFKSDGGLTINNNYNNNTISIIDGNTITTTSGGAADITNSQKQQNMNNNSSGSNNDSKIGSGIVDPSVINAKDMNYTVPTSEGNSLQKDRSGMLPRLA